jgi:hypothetical protein
MAWLYSLSREANPCAYRAYPHAVWGKELYGPFVDRRWIKTPADKRHKVKASSRTNTATRAPRSSDDAMAVKAVAYARWLATRDGFPLPDAPASVVWATVQPPRGKAESRIRAVRCAGVTFELPNWDWCPADPIEETLDAPSIAPALPHTREMVSA